MIKRAFAFLSSLVLAVSILAIPVFGENQFVPSTEHIDVTQASAELFAMDEIERVISKGREDCIWTEETALSEPVALYDPFGYCSGYVFKLYTGTSYVGYMQVNNLDGDFSRVSSSFGGIPAYEGLGGSIDSIMEISSDDRLYYFGSLTFCVKLENGNYQPIDNILQIEQEDAESYYSEYLVRRAQRKAESSADVDEEISTQNQRTRSVQSFTLVTTDDFSNLYATRPNGTRQQVTEHCSPTAATNIMLYFRSTGDSPLSASLSDSTIFMELYYAMDTNEISTSNTVQATGTVRTNIKTGISTFCTNRNCTPSSFGKISSVTLRKIKSRVDDGCLLLTSLDDYPSEGYNHSVVIFDYSGDEITISNGWDRIYHDIEYDDLDIAQFVYVGY